MHFSITKNQKGSALIFSVMVLLVLSILGVALLSVVAGNIRTSSTERKFQSAYYVAEAGAVYHMKAIKKEIMAIYLRTVDSAEYFSEIETFRLSYPKEMNTLEKEYGSQPMAEVTFERLDAMGSNPCTYRITSKGTLGDSTRIVTKIFKAQWVSGFMSVFSKGQMILDNGYIYGPIGTNDITSDAVVVVNNPYFEDINLLIEAGMVTPSAAWLADWDSRYSRLILPSPLVYELPPFPPFPVYEQMADASVGGLQVIKSGSVIITNNTTDGYILNLTDNAYIPKIEVKGGRVLNINVGDTDKSIVVDQIILSGEIHLIGEGKLTIYLTDYMSFTGDSGFNRPADESSVSQAMDAIEHLNVYMKGSGTTNPKTLNFTGAQKIYGSLYAEDAGIDFAGGGGFQGSVVTGATDVKISGAASIVTSILYAPNAHVTASGGGLINGPVVANTFNLSGGATIRYNPRTGIVYNPFGVEVGINLFDLIPVDGAIREK